MINPGPAGDPARGHYLTGYRINQWTLSGSYNGADIGGFVVWDCGRDVVSFVIFIFIVTPIQARPRDRDDDQHSTR